ncbi:hypothetical protein Cmtc_61070 [Cupriavidus sp. TKC]|uniref:hypothetical protein n=1 Tax=Cupriavidus sp. TKC TaxID=2880159 RepID=UPI0025A73867|nr:hypothetical protein [Cupriavidus sp. TKC]GMG94887.1 hypothetical protein Cmtc_61070 [Cupriavidus sp. TKC]
MTQAHMARTNGSSAAIAAIAYAVTAEEGITFLRCWQQGEFETIRVDWPNAPEAVFLGVEPPELAQLSGRDDAPQERSTFAEQVIRILESSASAWDDMRADEPDENARGRMRARSDENRGNVERIKKLLADANMAVPHGGCPAPVDATEAKERDHLGCPHCGTGVYAAGLTRAADIAEGTCSQSRNHLFRSAAKIIAAKIRAESPEPAPRGGDAMLQAFKASGLKPTAGNRRAFRAGFVSAAPPPVVWDGQPVETILYWAKAYSGSGFGGGHGMIVRLLNEYAELSELVAAFGASIRLAPFQWRVQPWMLECFGAKIAADRAERNHRFYEEATELVQANGMTCSEAHQLVDYTFGRPPGELKQEIGGVMVTLAALCLASGADMHLAGETELARIWTIVEKIRAKQAAKPKHSPLPEYVPAAVSMDRPLRDRILQIAMEADAAANLGGNQHMASTLADISERLLHIVAPIDVTPQQLPA